MVPAAGCAAQACRSAHWKRTHTGEGRIVISGWLLLVVAAIYVGVLFVVGLIETIVVPKMLARRWRSPK